MKRVGAMATLFIVASLSAGEAQAQPYALKFHDVTEVLAPASVGTVPTDHPDISDSYAIGSNLIGGTLNFAEGDLRTYEFFAAAADGAKPGTTTVRIELLGEGADAYRLSAGALSTAGLPIIPREPSLLTTAPTLSAAAHGDLLRIRARRDDDLAAPARAVLRISFVSGESISNLPLEFALTTMDAGRQLGVSDVTDQVAAAHTSASVVAWRHSEANRVRGGDHLVLGEGAARTYVLRAPLGLFTLPAMSVSLAGDGADQFKVGVGLLSTPNLDRADVAPAANGEIVITLMAAADADADAATATLSIAQDDGSSPALSNLPLVLALSSVDYDDVASPAPFVPGDTGRFILTPSVSEAVGGVYVTFDLAVDLGVSHGCKGRHCGIDFMALEIVWDDADFILDTDAMNAVPQSDSTGTIYYVARGARRGDDPANGAQPAAGGRVHLSQDPGDADYNMLYFTRAGTRSKLVMLLLDSFEDTDREIRCDAEDAASSRYCGNFQLLRLGLFTRTEPAVGERLEVEARLWRADGGDADALLASRGVAASRAVNPVVAYESDSASVTVIRRGAASLALEPATRSQSISALETAEASATVAFLKIADDGDDHLPALLSVALLKYAEDGVVGAEVADLRMAVTGPGLSAPVIGERDAATNAFRFDFTALPAGGLLVADGAVSTWAVTVWMDDMGANHTYADQTSFTLSIAHHMSAETIERRLSEESLDASRNAVDFHIDIVGTRLQIAGGVDAIRETLTIPPADAKISTFTLQIGDAKGSVDVEWTGNWTSILGIVTFDGVFSAASHPFVNGESRVTDARIGFAPAYGDDGRIGGITFGLDREGVDASGPRFDFELAVHAQSLIATEPPTVTDDLATGASLSVPLEAVAFYRQAAAGDCRRFAQNCVMDKDFNGDVAITASLVAVGDTTATGDLAPVIVNFASGRAMLELDLAAASLPNLGLLAVTLDYPALNPAHRAFAVTLATVPYDFRRLRLAFEETSTLRVDEAASPRICVASSVANYDDSATVEVIVSLSGGTASGDEDYTLAAGDEFSLRIASGESRACHALTLIDDAIAEHDEHLEFQITQVAYTGAGSTVTKLIRAEDVLRLVIQDDDDVTVRIAPSAVEFREQTPDGGGVAASASLQISLWDGLNAARYSDDLGGRRALRFNVAAGSASLSGVCPADAATISADGADFCLRLPAGAAAGVDLSAADTTAGATFSLEYERNGADRFVVEIVAPGDGVLEGEDSFEISIDGLSASVDSAYVWPSTATAPGLAEQNLSVAMHILDAEEAVPVLVDAEGLALRSVTLIENAPSAALHAELRDAGGAALAPDEDVGVQITISGLAGVSFVGRSTATRTLDLTIAANATRTASFRLIAAADDNSIPESGTLGLLARGGGADAPLPADAEASAPVRVRDLDFVPSALLFNGVAEARMALRQAQARQMVTATLSFSGLNQYDEPMDLRAVAVEVRANDGATADLRRASSPDGFVTTLTLLIETDEDRDATVTLTATLDGVSATATIRVAAAPRVARRIEVRATTAVLYASADAEGVAASFIVGVVDNYGDFGALASTVTLTAVADDGQTPFYPRRIAVPPGGVSVSVAVTPTVDADMRLSLSATRDGLAPGRAEVRVRAARALSALKLDGATTTTRFFDQRDVGLGQAVTARFVLRATDQYGDAFAVDAARIAVRTNSSATYALDRMLASDGLRSDLTLRITPFEDEDATLRLTASGGDRAMAQAVITVAAVARAIERLRVAGPTAALSQSGLDEPVEVIFNVAAVDNYGADDVLPATTATLEVSADDGRMPRAPAAARIEPGGVAVSVVVTPSAGVDVRVRLAATLGGLTETAEALVTAVEARRLDRLLLNGEAMTTLFLNQHSVGLRMPVSGGLRLAALDQYGDPHATRVAVDASVVGGARLSGLPSSLTVRVTGADLSFEVLPDEDADAVLTLRVASGEVSAEAVIDVDAVDRRPQSLNLRRLADTVVQTEFNQTLVLMFDLELRDNYGDAGRLPPTLVNLEATVDQATAVTLPPTALVSTPTTVEVRVTPQGQDDTLTLSARVGALVAVEMVDIDALETGLLTLDGDDSVQVDEEGIASFVMTLGATDSAGNLVALDGEVVRFTAVVDNETIEIVSFAAVSRAGTSALSVAMASTEVASAEMSVDVEIRVRLRSVATVELTLRAQSAGVNLGDAVARVRVLPSVAAFDVDDNGEVEYDDLIVILRYLMLSPKERTAAPVASMTRNLRMSDRNGLIEKLSVFNDPINDDLLDLDGDGEANSYDGRLLVRYLMFGRTFTDYGDRVGERILRLMGM